MPARVAAQQPAENMDQHQLLQKMCDGLSLVINRQKDLQIKMNGLIGPELKSFFTIPEEEGKMWAEWIRTCASSFNESNVDAHLMDAYAAWTQLVARPPPPNGMVDNGRILSALLLFHGHLHKAVRVLREVVRLSPTQPITRETLIRLFVRLHEWEALHSFLEEEKELSPIPAGRDGPLVSLRSAARLIMQCMIEPSEKKGAKARELSEFYDKHVAETSKTFASFELQMLILEALGKVGRRKFAAQGDEKTFDYLYAADEAQQKADAIVRNRFSLRWDKVLDAKSLALTLQSGVSALRTMEAFANWMELSKAVFYEYRAAGMHKDALTLGIPLIFLSLRVCTPYWLLSSLNASFFLRRDSRLEAEYMPRMRSLLEAFFQAPNDDEKNTSESSQGSYMEMEGKPPPTACCSTPIVDRLTGQLNALSLKPTVKPPHLLSDGCTCPFCVQCSSHVGLAMESTLAELALSDFSSAAMRKVRATYERMRMHADSDLVALIGKVSGRPRPPLQLSSVLCVAACEFAAMPSPRPDDENPEKADKFRKEIIDIGIKVTSYSPTLIEFFLTMTQMHWKNRGGAWNAMQSMDADARMPWLQKSVSFSTSILAAITNAMPLRLTTRRDQQEAKEEKKAAPPEMARELKKWRAIYDEYAHLLHYKWRFPLTCTIGTATMDDPWTSAMFLIESCALATRQAKRVITKQMVPFGFRKVTEFEYQVGSIPPDMTVLHLITTHLGDLYLVKLHAEREPIIVPIAKASKLRHHWEAVKRAVEMNEETSTMSKNAEASGKKICARKFWEERRKAEGLMHGAVKEIETEILGPFALLMLPSLQLTVHGKKECSAFLSSLSSSKSPSLAKAAAHLKAGLLAEIMSIAFASRPSEFLDLLDRLAVVYTWPADLITSFAQWKIRIEQCAAKERFFVPTGSSAPMLFLVLSPDVAELPWEALSVLQCRKQRLVARVVSLHYLIQLIGGEQMLPRPADPHNSYFVLDPGNDLAETQKRISEIIDKFKLKGVVGRAPEVDVITKALAEKDFLYYFGHGGMQKYVSRVAIRKSTCHSCVILMGCGSVSMMTEGPGLDGKSTSLDYAVSGCPCLVGALWTVTDGEIDRYTKCFFDALMGQLKNNIPCSAGPLSSPTRLRILLEALAESRLVVKLPLLTGCAVVCYGIPIAATSTVKQEAVTTPKIRTTRATAAAKK